MLLQDIFKSIIVSALAQARPAATKFLLYLAGKLNLHFCTQQCGATTRTLRRPHPGSMTSRVQGVRIGVPLEMIKMVRMRRGAGVWRVPDAMGTGGALRAQVGKAQRTLVNWSDVAFRVQPFFPSPPRRSSISRLARIPRSAPPFPLRREGRREELQEAAVRQRQP